MASLASVLAERGWRLTASDATVMDGSRVMDGALVINSPCDAAGMVAAADIVIHSAAVNDESPEMAAARRRGAPCLTYPRAIAELARDSRLVAIAGTHGKSTTTAMLAEILAAAGIDATSLCGARRIDGRPCARSGGSHWMVVEACEYRRHFLNHHPRLAAILSIEPDHFDCFRDDETLDGAFAAFASQVEPDGAIVANADCRRAMLAAASTGARVVTFARRESADWTARVSSVNEGRRRFDLRRQSVSFCHIELRVAGEHQLGNAMAAAALAHEMGVGPESISRGLGAFAGISRRLEVAHEDSRIVVVDDYAHHPTEVAAAVAATREMYPGRRLCVVFEPHQASRLTRLLDEFANSLHNADWLAITDVHRAREARRHEGEATCESLAARTRGMGVRTAVAHDFGGVLAELTRQLTGDEVLLTLGAGDIRNFCDAFIDRIRGDRSPE